MTNFSYRLSRGPLFVGPILLELLNFALTLLQAPTLLRIIVGLPALFILPGILLLGIFKGTGFNAQLLVVEGFFLSTIIVVVITALMLTLGFPFTSLTYSLVTLFLVGILATILLLRRIELIIEDVDFILLGSALAAYIFLLMYFASIPRFFTPDETGYIFSARMGILQGIVPPITGRPDTSLIASSVQGRYFWIYLLISFISSSGVLPKEAGLLCVSYVVMTALASSLFMKGKWLSRAVFLIVLCSPIIIVFAASTLDDLAVAFYATIAGFFLVQSFSKVQDQVSIDVISLLLSFLASAVAALLKLNPVVFVATWIISTAVIFRYRLYSRNSMYKILALTLILPAVCYELILDLPYFIFYDILQNVGLGSMFGRLLLFRVSPIENLVELFVPLWWNPAANTLVSKSSVTFVDYFYRLLMPEALSLIVAAVILGLPILLSSRADRTDFSRTTLGVLVLVSILVFYLETIRFEFLNDVARYALVIVPLSIPLAIGILKEFKDRLTYGRILSVFLPALILIWVNEWLAIERGGIYIGYAISMPRLQSIVVMLLEYLLFAGILCLPFLARKMPGFQSAFSKRIRLRSLISKESATFSLIVILILLNGVYFSTVAIGNSQMYKNRDFSGMANTIQQLSNSKTLVFANNYIQLRPYVSDQLLSEGLLPPPATSGEFQNLLQTAPNGSMIVLSNDSLTAHYEYGNSYLSQYFHSKVIATSSSGVTELPRINLTQPFLSMNFENANSSTVVDDSGFGNNGVNYGANVVAGYYGSGLNFSGSAYVSIPSNNDQNVQDQISISFLAKIESTDPYGHMILSKGYAVRSGSYDVFDWNRTLYFELGGVGSLSVPATPYIGAWHQFIFTYDGNQMIVLIDGVLRNSIQANGIVRQSTYNLEIGRDSERQTYYFVGTIDELQISNKPLDLLEFARSYHSSFAVQINQYSQGDVFANLYRIVNVRNHTLEGSVSVEDAQTTLDENLTITLKVHVHAASTSNITILVGTELFTNVYLGEVGQGETDLTYRYDFIPPNGGLYWPYFFQERVIVIDSGGNMIFNQFTPFGSQNTFGISRLVFLWSASLLWCGCVLMRFTLPSYCRKSSD